MSAPDIRKIFRFPGRLIKSPTNLSAASPYGGTQMGIARAMKFQTGYKVVRSDAEEFGRRVAVTLAGEYAVLTCVLRTYDNDAISTLFPNTSAPTLGRLRGIDGRASGSGISRAGTALDASAFKLLFVPLAIEEHPAILIYNAVPVIDEAAELQMSIGQEFGLACMFEATPDSSGRDYSVKALADLSL